MEKETNVCKNDALRRALWRRATGYEVEEMHHALGEYTEIQDIYCQHIQDCIDDIYGKRSSHRPAIPNVK